MPHRAHVLRRGQHPRGAPDDPRRRRRGSGAARSTRSCRCSSRTSPASSAPWTGCPSPSACSIRRCTSSCRTEDEQIAVVAEELRRQARRRARARRRAARGQPDARPPRLPPGRSPIPEIYETQVRAIIEAAVEVKRDGVDVKPEIMIPIVGHERELAHHARAGRSTPPTRRSPSADEKVAYTVGTMIELPRACLVADKHRRATPTSSRFGTNDLTQTTLGVSRDDAGALPRRLRQARHLPGRSVRRHRSGGRRASSCASASRRAARAKPRPQDRHLRRARRRAVVGGVLPQRSASTTSAARRSACRSPASPPPRPRSRRQKRLPGVDNPRSLGQPSAHINDPTPRLMRTCLFVAALVVCGCHWDLNSKSTDPQSDQLYFPAGIAMDPGGQLVYVSNGNADLRYGGGTVDDGRHAQLRVHRRRLSPLLPAQRQRRRPIPRRRPRNPSVDYHVVWDNAKCRRDAIDPSHHRL